MREKERERERERGGGNSIFWQQWLVLPKNLVTVLWWCSAEWLPSPILSPNVPPRHSARSRAWTAAGPDHPPPKLGHIMHYLCNTFFNSRSILSVDLQPIAYISRKKIYWKRDHCRWMTAEFWTMLGSYGFWAGRDLYRATPAVTRGLGFCGLI